MSIRSRWQSLSRMQQVVAGSLLAGVGYGAAVIGSTAILHPVSEKVAAPLRQLNTQAFLTAPLFTELRTQPQAAHWLHQQSKLSFHLVTDGARVNWNPLHTATTARERGRLMLQHKIALLPEPDTTLRPTLIADGKSGCVFVPIGITPKQSAAIVTTLLGAFENAGKRAGSYALVADGVDMMIIPDQLPVGRTAEYFCTQKRPVWPHNHHA